MENGAVKKVFLSFLIEQTDDTYFKEENMCVCMCNEINILFK